MTRRHTQIMPDPRTAPPLHPLVMLTALPALLMLTAVPIADARDAAPDRPRSSARWLMDYALAYADTVGNPTGDDADFVSILLLASTTLDPHLADAYLAQYRLLAATDRPVDALATLDAYCRLRPQDINAQLQRIDLIVNRAQTVEQRIEKCQQLLKQSALPPPVSSDLNRRIAQLRYASGEIENARRHAQQALSDYPDNIAARTVLAQIDNRDNQPDVQLDLLLRQLRANPLDIDRTWKVAQLLERNHLTQQAAHWYQDAIALAQKLNPGVEPPLDIQLDLARTLLADGQYLPCLDRCVAILAVDPWRFDATLLQLEAARLARSGDLFDRTVKQTLDQYSTAEERAIQTKDWVTCARIAWLAIDIAPNPQRALRFAELAHRFNPNSRLTRRIFGWAQLTSGSPEQALTTLDPLAATDPLAALGLARAQLALADRSAAIRAIQPAIRAQLSPVVRNRVADTLRQLGLTLPSPPDQNTPTATLESADRRTLQFFDNSAIAINFQVTTDTDHVDFDDTIIATISLTNTADYDIALGLQRMLNPVVAVSLRDTTYNGLFFDNYMTIELYGDPVLHPGQTRSTERVITVSAARFLIDRQPQRRFDLIFNFVLDPAVTDTSPPVSRLAIPPIDIHLTRNPLDATLTGLAQLAKDIHEGDINRRVRAVRALRALLVEKNKSLVARATYRAEPVDPAMIEALLRRAFADPDPRVRAQALFGWTTLPLDDATAQAASPLILDQDWLVRLVAVEVFAKRHGRRFLPVLTDRAQHDDNPLVARLANLYIRKMTGEKK